MREIKFRAWIQLPHHQPHMILPGDMATNPLEVVTLNGKVLKLDENFELGTARPASLYLPDQVILMQFTGLKDKNSVEIYEGSIVKQGIFVFEIVWSDRFSCFKMKIDKSRTADNKDILLGFGQDEAADCEVVGNIYENPGLLPPPQSGEKE